MQKILKKTPKPGRPPLPDGEARDKRLNDVRFSASELSKLKGLAEKSGKSWTAWVRSKLGL